MTNKIEEVYRKRARARQVQKESDKAEEALNNIVNSFLKNLDVTNPEEQRSSYLQHKNKWRLVVSSYNILFKVTRCRIAAFDDKLLLLIQMHDKTKTYKKEIRILKSILKEHGVSTSKQGKLVRYINGIVSLFKNKLQKVSA